MILSFLIRPSSSVAWMRKAQVSVRVKEEVAHLLAASMRVFPAYLAKDHSVWFVKTW